jgi:DHA3 family macrolide efflux protein-like MFS transporter
MGRLQESGAHHHSALILAGLGLSGLGLVPPEHFFVGTGLLAVVGFSYPFLDGPLNAILQARVPPDKQGRVFSLYWTGAALTSPLGFLLAGPAAERLGLLFWFMAGGLAIALTGVTCLFIPRLIHFGRIDPAEDQTPGLHINQTEGRMSPPEEANPTG